MEYTLLNVLIVDDESIVREGLKNVINWASLGFCICSDASTGEEAIEKIAKYNPNLVLLDIRMPVMDGIELMDKVRSSGFTGDFIILSGYSDFKYAQTALHYGVSFYLMKPIDEVALEKAVLTIRDKIIKNQEKEKSLKQYLIKAKVTVLRDLLLGTEPNMSINYIEMGLHAPIYQVVMYESYTPFFTSYSFADLLKVTNQGNNSFEHITLNNQEIIVLKGNNALNKFNDCLSHYESGTQKGSPLDTIFLTYGKTVSNLFDIISSYNDCKVLMSRRFFCYDNQHVLSYEDLPKISSYQTIINVEKSQFYSDSLINYIQIKNKLMVSEILKDLKNSLSTSGDDAIAVKRFLVDIFLQTKQGIMQRYNHIAIPFAHNSVIIEVIENKYYLYEILQYFLEQFEMMIRAIGNTANEYILEDILYYIEHNYSDQLKLESIGSLFGYNSSYLGKLFTQKMNQNFNAYLDEIRIKHSVELLESTQLKVYEIAAKVGYHNVNYFHYKFKKIKGISPVEYRKKD